MSIAPSPSPEAPPDESPAADSRPQSALQPSSTPSLEPDLEPVLAASETNSAALSTTRLGKWRPFLSCGGALGLGLLLAHALVKPAPRRAAVEGAANGGAAQIYLSRAATLVVSAQKPPGALLRGKISLVADLTGRAPVSGAVARQLVEPGTRVKRGDAVMEISSGQAERPAPRVESLQNVAEQSQIQAADAQTALVGKVGAAQAQLQSAQERVAAAQTQISVARDLVRRLQNGENVARSELPATFRAKSGAVSDPVSEAAPEAPRPRRRRRRARNSARTASDAPKTTPSPVESRAAAIALQQARAATDAAREGSRDLQTARQMLALAQTNGRETDEKLKAAAVAVDGAEKDFEAKKVTGADVETARSAQRDAQAAAIAAAKGVASAKLELAKREKSAASLQQYAEKAQSEANQLSAASKSSDAPDSASKTADASTAASTGKPLKDEASTDEAATDEAAPLASSQTVPQVTADANSGRVSLAEAARFAGAAVAESRSASRDAERIHAQIEAYQGQVTSSRTRIESATKNLATAQQKVLDSVPRPRFTSAVAPADGIVTWVSRLAREVGAGQSLFGLASGNKIGVRFEDKSGLWRGLKAGENLPAMVVVAPTAAENGTPQPSATPGKPVLPASNNVPTATPGAAGSAAVSGAVASVQVTEITPPEAVGQAAQVTGDLRTGSAEGAGGGAAAALRAGMDVLISVAQPNAKPTLSVPVSALVKRGAVDYLAVLSPVLSPDSPSIPASSPSANVFHLKWQAVEIGRSDGLRQEIRTGLKAGARVVVSPSDLEAMGFLAPEATTEAATEAADENANAATATAENSLPAIEICLTDA